LENQRQHKRGLSFNPTLRRTESQEAVIQEKGQSKIASDLEFKKVQAHELRLLPYKF